MGQSTLLAFGLVVIAIIQSNAAPSPKRASVSVHDGAVGPCLIPAPAAVNLSGHEKSTYEKAAKDLKDHIESGGYDLEYHGNGEGCLPAVGAGETYYEGYVPHDKAWKGGKKGPARVIVKVLADGSVDGTWYYTIGHYAPGTWSGPKAF